MAEMARAQRFSTNNKIKQHHISFRTDKDDRKYVFVLLRFRNKCMAISNNGNDARRIGLMKHRKRFTQ